jgi:ankyrin repeat protein
MVHQHMGSTDSVSDRMDPTEGISSKPLLLRLPNELFFDVGSHFESFNDLNSLVRTSRFFHRMFNTHLYRRAVAADDIVLDDIVGWVLSEYRLASLTHLLDHGLAVNHIGRFVEDGYKETMLRFLCKLEDQERSAALARLLIQRGADTNSSESGIYRDTLLYTAVCHRNCSIAALLLAHGVDVNATDVNGDTLLHVACFMHGNNAEMIHLLIAHGADIEARSPDFDVTPLLACSTGHAMSALLEHGADVGVHDSIGETLWHRFARWAESEHHELARSLLEHHAIVDATDMSGYTPLNILLLNHMGDPLFMTQFLLENGADVNAVSNEGLSILQYALRGRCAEHVVGLLLEHGADVSRLDSDESQLLSRWANR